LLLLVLQLDVQGNATTLSNGLLSAIKAAGGDGKIDVSELKGLLGLIGLRKA
jgi:hypothetical protein